MSSHPAEARARGLSAATVAEWLHADRGKPWAHRDAGGGLDPTQGGIGGMAPSASSMDPMTQGAVQRYSSLPTEKLQELAARTAGTQQGQIIQQVLRQKQFQPNAGAAQQPQPLQPQARGGVTGCFDLGGGMSMGTDMPSWTRTAASQMAQGYLHGSTLGRADALTTTAPGGSYVIPADVIAGLGEGNNLAGARIMQEAISSGPWGTPHVRMGHGANLPHPHAQADAKGGGVQAGAGAVPVRLSHGEFVITPEQVTAIGGGDLKHGHKVLDHFVETRRAKDIKKLKSLPGPVKERARGGALRRDSGGSTPGSTSSSPSSAVPNVNISFVPNLTPTQGRGVPQAPQLPQQQDNGMSPLQILGAYKDLKGILGSAPSDSGSGGLGAAA